MTHAVSSGTLNSTIPYHYLPLKLLLHLVFVIPSVFDIVGQVTVNGFRHERILYQQLHSAYSAKLTLTQNLTQSLTLIYSLQLTLTGFKGYTALHSPVCKKPTIYLDPLEWSRYIYILLYKKLFFGA